MQVHLLARITAAAVWVCSVAQAEVFIPVAEVIPAPGGLGPGWESQIEVLVESGTNPVQMLTPEEFSEATVKEWRRSVADTNQPLSGWARARFDFKSHTATNRYYLQVDRFRSEAAIAKRWASLLESGSARQNTFPRDIGEAAFVAHEKGSVALWFRRGSFIVNVSSFGATPPEEPDGSLRHLAAMTDSRISGVIGTPGLVILQRKSKGEPLRTGGVVPGSPAQRAGIKPDGFLISVDGTNVVNLSLAEVLSRVRGAVGTLVTLELADSSLSHTNKFTLKRGRLVHSRNRLEVIEE